MRYIEFSSSGTQTAPRTPAVSPPTFLRSEYKKSAHFFQEDCSAASREGNHFSNLRSNHETQNMRPVNRFRRQKLGPSVESVRFCFRDSISHTIYLPTGSETHLLNRAVERSKPLKRSSNVSQRWLASLYYSIITIDAWIPCSKPKSKRKHTGFPGVCEV